jgi:hypothetical protein
MALQHDALVRRVSAQASVHNHLKPTVHSLEFHSVERLGLVRGRIHRMIKKTFDCLAIGNASIMQI